MRPPVTFPVLWQSLSPADEERLKEAGVPRSVPWAFVAPHERQAQDNHGQPVVRLAQRGGLSPAELLAVVTGRQWREVGRDVDAAPELMKLLREFDSQREGA